jgi:hypothetical protein
MVKCKICGKVFEKKYSLMTAKHICSEECKVIYKSSLPKRLSNITVEYWVEKGFSHEQATLKVKEEQRKRSKRCVEYWIHRGFSESEAISQVKEWQSEIGKRNAIKYSKEERQKRNGFCSEYWLSKGYSEEETKNILYEFASNQSKECFIRKYGVNEGPVLYDQLCSYRKENYSLSGYIKKYGEYEGTILWNKKFKHRRDSKMAINFFEKLLCHLDGYKIYTSASSLGEYGVYDPISKKYYLYDFVVPELNLCIEFNGDYWHCNPKKYESSYYHKQTGLLAEDIWKNDQVKRECILRERGFNTIIVWESDNKTTALKMILEKINEFRKS